jgi:hypothetical protein
VAEVQKRIDGRSNFPNIRFPIDGGILLPLKLLYHGFISRVFQALRKKRNDSLILCSVAVPATRK